MKIKRKPLVNKNMSSAIVTSTKTSRLNTPSSAAATGGGGGGNLGSTPMNRLSYVNQTKLLNSVLLSNSKTAANKRDLNQMNPFM